MLCGDAKSIYSLFWDVSKRQGENRASIASKLYKCDGACHKIALESECMGVSVIKNKRSGKDID